MQLVSRGSGPRETHGLLSKPVGKKNNSSSTQSRLNFIRYLATFILFHLFKFYQVPIG